MSSQNKTYKIITGQVDSSSTGDTVLYTGVANKIGGVIGITCIYSGTAPTFRLELDTGSSFGTTRIISDTDASSKGSRGEQYIITNTERIVINVTVAQAASTIDYTLSYYEIFEPGVY